MTNGELGGESYRPAYCPECGQDYQVAVGDGDDIYIICECTKHSPLEFIEELAEQLPLPSTDPPIEKVNKRDSDESRGFQ